MTPIQFKEANIVYGPPSDVHETACLRVPAHQSSIPKGPFEGATQVITAWRPTAGELERIINGEPIFLTVIGTLPPHRLSTSFDDASCYE